MNTKKVKDPELIVGAIERGISFGDLGVGIKRGTANAQLLRSLTARVEAIENTLSEQLAVAPLQRCLVYLGLCFSAKDNAYIRGTDDYDALVEFHGAISTALMGIAAD